MPIKQLEKEFWKKFVQPKDTKSRGMNLNNEALIIKSAENVWEWIENQVIPMVIKDMLVEERVVIFKGKDGKEFTNKDVGLSLGTIAKGFNQCCALQREKAKKYAK